MREKKIKTKILIFVFWLIVILGYLFTRLYNLTILPIFFDEANYIFWAKRIATDQAGWFLPLAYGKPVPFVWMVAGLLKFLPNDNYLLAGRVVSVFFGLITLLGTYKLGSFLFGKRMGLASAFLYVLSPFALFHDRITLYDSMLSAMLLWAVYFMFKQKPVLWGMFLGGALLTKASALSFEVLMPAAFVVLNGFKKFWMLIVAFVVSQIVANLQIISSGYLTYLQKSVDYTNQGNTFMTNLNLSLLWLNSYLTTPILLLCLLGFGTLLWKRPKIGVVFIILGIIPIVGFSFVGRIYFPRYVLFTLPYFILAFCFTLNFLLKKNRFIFLAIIPFILFAAIKFDYFLLTSPERAKLPEVDNWQYVSGYPSGYGFETIFKFLKRESNTNKIHLIVQGSFSHYPNAFFLEYWDNKNIWIEERWPLEKQGSQEFIPKNKKRPDKFDKTYLVVRNDYVSGLNNVLTKYQLQKIVEGKKPDGRDSVFVVIPK